MTAGAADSKISNQPVTFESNRIGSVRFEFESNLEYSQVPMINTNRRTRGWTLDRVHNSRRPLDRLFALCDPVTLTFDLLTNTNWWARTRAGLSTCQVWSLVIVVSAVLLLSCGQTNTQAELYTDAAKRFTPATVVSVSTQSITLLNFILHGQKCS